MIRFGMISTTNKPTHVTRQTASATDHIITNSIMHTGCKSGSIKTDISNHLPFSFIVSILRQKEDAKKEFKHKYKFSDQSIGTKLTLHDKLELSKTVKKSQ